jgi:UDP-glucuronate decarboxylase
VKILITGGAGFIGTNLTKKLLDCGHTITIVDNLMSSTINNIPNDERVEFFKHDIIQPLPLTKRFDQIYHLACPASPPQYQANPLHTLDTNYLGTRNVLDYAKHHGSKVLLTSTSEVYGDPLTNPQFEEYRGNTNTVGPRACYDEGKRIAETLVYEYYHQYGVEGLIARIFNTYGPYMLANDGRVVSNFINQAIRNEPITIYGDGSQTRSFCYVSDMVDGLIALMNKGPSATPINLGNPIEYSVLELAQIIIDMVKAKSEIVFKPLPVDDPKVRRPDITKAKRLLRWSPLETTTVGLEKTIAYFKEIA